MEKEVWQDIERLYREFQRLGINEAVDYEKYYLYSLITHSTAIEGSTLTERETQLLFDEGITASGKPLLHYLMNKDLKQAYDLARTEAGQGAAVTPALLRRLNAAVMRTTGGEHHMMAGTFDSSRGDYRLCGVTAGTGGKSYMDYRKVPEKVEALCKQLQARLATVSSLQERYELSFNAHLNLVTIHPWVDGNGRTARLLMHYVQSVLRLFPSKVFREDRPTYIAALRQSQDEERAQPFLAFMAAQLAKSLSSEIAQFQASQKQGFHFLF